MVYILINFFLLVSFSPIIKCFNCKIGLQFHELVLVIENNNYIDKIVNTNIVCNLDNWLINAVNKFIDADSLSFGNSFARNVSFSGFDDSSTLHTDYLNIYWFMSLY